MDIKDFQFEVKSTDDVNGYIEGDGAVYGNLDSHGDIIQRGAFTKSLRECNGEVVMLWQHDQAEPIGKWQVTDTSHGLHVRGRLVLSIPKARETYERLKAGLVTGLSIGYETLKSRQGRNGERLLEELALWEISTVTFPSNPLARITSVKRASATTDEIAAAFRHVTDRIRAEPSADDIAQTFRRLRHTIEQGDRL